MENGKRLKAWRESRGLSQAAAAELIQTQQRTWASWEIGGGPDIGNALKLERLTEGEIRVLDWAKQRRSGKRKSGSRSAA